MSDLTAHLDDLAPTPPVRALATDLAGRSAVESDRQAQYVSIRPAMEGAIAVYLHRRYVSIALPPERAAKIAPQFPGAMVRKKTPATTYLVLEDSLLGQQHDLAAELAHEAVAWRATGPKSGVGGGHSKHIEQELDVCLIHWMQLLPSGACPHCE